MAKVLMKVRYGLRFTLIRFLRVSRTGIVIYGQRIFFDAAKYPTITFQSHHVQVQENDITITGLLSIKDITQEIVFTAKYLGSVPDPMGNTKAGFEMDTLFDRKDFNITWNQFFDKQGILISDQVKLHADIQLLKLS